MACLMQFIVLELVWFFKLFCQRDWTELVPFRMLFSTMLATLSFLVLMPPLQADPAYPHSEKNGIVLAANQAAVTIQVSSFKKSREAEQEVARLKSHGLVAKIKYESVKGKGMWYRVYVGRYKNVREARAVADGLKAQGIISWAWIRPDFSIPARAKAPTKTSVAPGASSRKALESRHVTSESSAASPERRVSKEKSGESAPAPLAKPLPPATVLNSSTSEQSSKDKGTSRQKAPAVRESASKEPTESVSAGTFSFSSQTTLRAFQRDTIEGKDTAVFPLYEYMRMDFQDTERGGLSVHAYGWVRSDLADSNYFEDASDGELLYGYLAYSKPYSDLHLTLGRKQIFAGVTNDTVDGVQLAAGLGGMLSATMFGGVTAATDETSADTTYGGRVAFHPKPAYELAVSYQSTDLEDDSDQRAGVDLSINVGDWLTVQGLSGFNLESEDWHEHNYSAALRFMDITLEPVYQYFSYKDYFGNNTSKNSLFNFLQDSDEQVTITGADLHYQGRLPFRLTGRYNLYSYKLRQEGAAYYAVLIGVDLPGGVQLGGEAGRMNGETDDNIYSLSRAYFYWTDPFKLGSSAFISGDAIFQIYDAPVFGKDSATNYSLSAGVRFFRDILEVKLTGAYSEDPYFDSNLEGILTFQINY